MYVYVDDEKKTKFVDTENFKHEDGSLHEQTPPPPHIFVHMCAFAPRDMPIFTCSYICKIIA